MVYCHIIQFSAQHVEGALLFSGPIERILWAVVLALVVSYAAGTWLNRRRSKAIGAWLQAGLAAWSGKLSWRWLRSMTAGAEITVADPGRPFRHVTANYFMLTREVMPLWGVERLRGKRDTLAIRADLRDPPRYNIEVVPLNSELRRTLDLNPPEVLRGDEVRSEPWEWRVGPAGLGLATHGAGNDAIIAAAEAFTGRYGAHIRRLSLRDRQPHLVLFAAMDGLERMDAMEFAQALRRFATSGISGQKK